MAVATLPKAPPVLNEFETVAEAACVLLGRYGPRGALLVALDRLVVAGTANTPTGTALLTLLRRAAFEAGYYNYRDGVSPGEGEGAW